MHIFYYIFPSQSDDLYIIINSATFLHLLFLICRCCVSTRDVDPHSFMRFRIRLFSLNPDSGLNKTNTKNKVSFSFNKILNYLELEVELQLTYSYSKIYRIDETKSK